MYVRQRPAAGALLLDTGRPCGFPEHPPLSNEHDMPFRELFLELPREPANFKFVRTLKKTDP